MGILDSIPNSCSEDEGDGGCALNSEPESDLDTPKPLSPRHQFQRSHPHQPIPTLARNGLLVPSKQIRGMNHSTAPKIDITSSKWGTPVHQVVSQDTRASAYFSCVWRKPQTKKHKTWDGDAYLKVEGSKITMFDEEGNALHTSALKGGMLLPGQELMIGGKDVEVDSHLTYAEFKKATDILNRANHQAPQPTQYASATFAPPFKRPTQIHPPRMRSGPIPVKNESTEITSDSRPIAGPSLVSGSTTSTPAPAGKAIASYSFYAKSTPEARRIVLGEKNSKERAAWGGAIHDPNAEGAVVMQPPTKAMLKQKGVSEAIPVVVDPLLSARMRDHQKEGVKFMYRCVMGMTGANANGCILADEMGLGKTLQTIALIQTLLKQTPYKNETAVIGKALIVCPASLVTNWRKEFRKWTGGRINIVDFDGRSGQAISHFVNNPAQQVLIIGYEKLRKVIKELKSCVPKIGLIVCDEGHRLKSKDNKTTKMFTALSTPRRIILSGTPVQNDLGEYWAMVDFTCPGLLGTYSAFARRYEKPILKSRSPGCNSKDLESGLEAARELADLSKEFVLRRLATVLDNYLPPKYEYVCFIAPSKLQLDVFATVMGGKNVAGLLRGSMGIGVTPLALIDLLRKISNSPMLLKKKDENSSADATDVQQTIEDALKVIPKDAHSRDVTTGGKLFALDRMLHKFYRDTDEKVVLVSNWTATLDLLASLCATKKYSYLRLDGSTPQKTRQSLVDQFNREKKDQSFIFLLSAKAGGTGLNLIGASRLVLFDSDWNPSTDLQAMARIHRDGQKRPVFLYRFLTTNTIDEKVYQRQLTKTGLSDQMMDHAQSKQDTKDSFSMEELRAIFRMDSGTNGCQTHDLLECDCCDHQARKTREAMEAKLLAQSEMTDLSHKIEGIESADDDSEDEMQKGFVQASQYDPEPTSKMLKKAAKDQQDKLSALKKWKHIDAFEDSSFKETKDTVLHNLFWEDWTSAQNTSVDGRGKKVSPTWNLDDDGDETITTRSISELSGNPETDQGTRTIRRAKGIDLLDMLDEAGLNESDDEGDDDGNENGVSSENDSNHQSDTSDIEPTLGKKRKSTSRQSSRSAKTRRSDLQHKISLKARHSKGVTNFVKEKKHDLRSLAENGMGGKIMFVFEKVSQSIL